MDIRQLPDIHIFMFMVTRVGSPYLFFQTQVCPFLSSFTGR